jgi:hypothetical protein
MATSGTFEDTYVTRREPKEAFRFRVRYDSSGCTAEVWNQAGDLVGRPSVVMPAPISSKPTQEQQCRQWIEATIEDDIGLA